MKNRTPVEAWEQERVFRWIRANQIRYPKLQLAYATLNGVRLTPKQREEIYKQGNRKGVSDLVFPFWSHDRAYCGMYLELKRLKGGQVSSEQKMFIRMVEEEGYLGTVKKGHREAIQQIKEYMGIEA